VYEEECQTACCQGRPLLPFSLGSVFESAGIYFPDALSMNRAVQQAQGSMTEEQGSIQGTLKVMKRKVILDKLWNILP